MALKLVSESSGMHLTRFRIGETCCNIVRHVSKLIDSTNATGKNFLLTTQNFCVWFWYYNYLENAGNFIIQTHREVATSRVPDPELGDSECLRQSLKLSLNVQLLNYQIHFHSLCEWCRNTLLKIVSHVF